MSTLLPQGFEDKVLLLTPSSLTILPWKLTKGQCINEAFWRLDSWQQKRQQDWKKLCQWTLGWELNLCFYQVMEAQWFPLAQGNLHYTWSGVLAHPTEHTAPQFACSLVFWEGTAISFAYNMLKIVVGFTTASPEGLHVGHIGLLYACVLAMRRGGVAPDWFELGDAYTSGLEGLDLTSLSSYMLSSVKVF